MGDMDSVGIGWHIRNYMAAESAISVLCIWKRRFGETPSGRISRKRVCRTKKLCCREARCGQRESNPHRPLSPANCPTDQAFAARMRYETVPGLRPGVSFHPFPDGPGLNIMLV